MDIFTTVLTRVVPVPIKPTSLKVKALLKDAGAGKLKEDLDHLENHKYYFGNESQKENKQEQNLAAEQEQVVEGNSLHEKQDNNTDEVITESKDGIKHLDLYV